MEDLRFKIRDWQIKVLQFIAKKIVRQSRHHADNIQEYYSVIIEAAKEEFTEDNNPTLRAFMEELHEKALDKHVKIKG